MTDRKKPAKTPAAADLSKEDLEKISGGPIYMKIDGVDGSVTAAGHEKWIELDSVQMSTRTSS